MFFSSKINKHIIKKQETDVYRFRFDDTATFYTGSQDLYRKYVQGVYQSYDHVKFFNSYTGSLGGAPFGGKRVLNSGISQLFSMTYGYKKYDLWPGYNDFEYFRDLKINIYNYILRKLFGHGFRNVSIGSIIYNVLGLELLYEQINVNDMFDHIVVMKLFDDNGVINLHVGQGFDLYFIRRFSYKGNYINAYVLRHSNSTNFIPVLIDRNGLIIFGVNNGIYQNIRGYYTIQDVIDIFVYALPNFISYDETYYINLIIKSIKNRYICMYDLEIDNVIDNNRKIYDTFYLKYKNYDKLYSKVYLCNDKNDVLAIAKPSRPLKMNKSNISIGVGY